jgi:transposase
MAHDLSHSPMLTAKVRQRSFYDADQICESPVPPDSFYRKLRDVVAPLIQDDQFKDTYCVDNERPAIPPASLVLATILQFHRNCSERQMEWACMYDLNDRRLLHNFVTKMTPTRPAAFNSFASPAVIRRKSD